MAVLELCAEILFVKQILEFLGEKVNYPIIVNVDNQGAVFLAQNDGASMRTRHIDVRHHFIRDLQHCEPVRLQMSFLPSEDNHADNMTKNLPEGLFVKHATALKEGKLGCWREDVGNG